MKYIDFNNKSLQNRIKGFSKGLKSDLKNFFASFSTQEALNTRNFDKLYSDWSNNKDDWSNSCLTAILLAAEIDPIPYLTILPQSCFDNVGVTRLDIPLSIKEIRDNAVNHSFPIDITYEGTMEQFKDIHHLWTYGRDLKIQCNDGDIFV